MSEVNSYGEVIINLFGQKDRIDNARDFIINNINETIYHKAKEVAAVIGKETSKSDLLFDDYCSSQVNFFDTTYSRGRLYQEKYDTDKLTLATAIYIFIKFDESPTYNSKFLTEAYNIASIYEAFYQGGGYRPANRIVNGKDSFEEFMKDYELNKFPHNSNTDKLYTTYLKSHSLATELRISKSLIYARGFIEYMYEKTKA